MAKNQAAKIKNQGGKNMCGKNMVWEDEWPDPSLYFTIN